MQEMSIDTVTVMSLTDGNKENIVSTLNYFLQHLVRQEYCMFQSSTFIFAFISWESRRLELELNVENRQTISFSLSQALTVPYIICTYFRNKLYLAYWSFVSRYCHKGVDRDVSTAYCLSSSDDDVDWLCLIISSTVAVCDLCISILAVVVNDWRISILIVLTKSYSLTSPLWYRSAVVLFDRRHPIHPSGISIPLSIPIDIVRVKPYVNGFFNRTGLTMSVSVKKFNLVPKRIMSELVLSMFWNGWGLSTCKPYVSIETLRNTIEPYGLHVLRNTILYINMILYTACMYSDLIRFRTC